MKVGEQLREIWRRATGSGRKVELSAGGADGEVERRTLALPAILTPVQFAGRHLPKPTPMNLRRFAETPVVRRAINVIKDRIAAMDWQVRVRRGVGPVDAVEATKKLAALRRMLEEPNAVDSFRTLIEQVIEDALTGGYGAIEMEPTGDAERPAMLWAVDGASIRINPRWDGQSESPRYAQSLAGQLESNSIELRDDQLMYVRMAEPMFDIVCAFSLPGQWTSIDPNSADYDPNIGELTLPWNVLGLPYNEVAVTYTAGLTTIGDDVKTACAQIVRNAQSTPALNASKTEIDTMQMQYFSSSLVDETVQAWLRPYVANRLG